MTEPLQPFNNEQGQPYAQPTLTDGKGNFYFNGPPSNTPQEEGAVKPTFDPDQYIAQSKTTSEAPVPTPAVAPGGAPAFDPDAYLAEKKAAEVSHHTTLDAKVTPPAPVQQPEEAEPQLTGPDNLRARADIGLSGDFDNKQKKFTEYFGPEATLKQQFEAPDPSHPEKTEPVLYYTLKPGDAPARFTQKTSEAVKLYGQTILDDLGEKALSITHGVLNEDSEDDPEYLKERDAAAKRIEMGYKNVLYNIYADNSGNLPAAIGSSAATGGAGGVLGKLLTILSSGAGAAAGQYANDTIENIRQYTVKNELGDVMTAGKDAALATAGGQVVGKIFSMIGGAGMVTLDAASKKLIDISRELNLPMPMPQQVMRSFIGMQKLTNQVRGMISGIGNYAEHQADEGYKLLRSLSPTTRDDLGNTTSTSYRDLPTVAKSAWDDYMKNLDTANPKPGLSLFHSKTRQEMGPFQVAGQNADAGLDIYSKQSGQAVTDAYTYARSYGEPVFNFAEVQKAAENASRGMTRDALIEGAAVPGGARISERPTANLQQVLDDIRTIDPAAVDTDAMNELRSRLFKYTQTNAVGRFDTPQAASDAEIARPVYSALNEAFSSASSSTPSGATATGFAKAWKEASKMARERFENLEMAKVIQLAKSGEGDISTTLSGLAQTLTSSTGRQWENLNLLKSVLPKDQFVTFGQAVEDTIRSDPMTMWNKIEKFNRDPQTRKLLWDDSYWNRLRGLGEEYRDLNLVNIPALLESQNNAWQVANQLVPIHPGAKVDTVGIDKLYQMAGGIDSPAGQSIRASIVDRLINFASKPYRDTSLLNGARLQQALDSLDNKNMLQFLAPQDLRNLRGVAFYLRELQGGTSDMGASLEAASEFAKIRHLEFDAIWAFAKAKVISQILVSKAGQNLFYGNGSKISRNFIPEAAAALSQLTRDRYQEQQEREKPTTFLGQMNKALFGDK